MREVAVYAFDRLGRCLRDLPLLLDAWNAAGTLICIRESIDLTTPAGRFMVQIIGTLAEFERENIRERVRSGIARVKATGKARTGRPLGRPRRQVDLHRIAALRAMGRSWRAIAVSGRCRGERWSAHSRPKNRTRPRPEAREKRSASSAARKRSSLHVLSSGAAAGPGRPSAYEAKWTRSDRVWPRHLHHATASSMLRIRPR